MKIIHDGFYINANTRNIDQKGFHIIFSMNDEDESEIAAKTLTSILFSNIPSQNWDIKWIREAIKTVISKRRKKLQINELEIDLNAPDSTFETLCISISRNQTEPEFLK